MDSMDKEMHDIDTGDNPWASAATGSCVADQISEKESKSGPPGSISHLVDGGFKAWSILAGAFLFEALIWGMFVSEVLHYLALIHFSRLSSLIWCLPIILF